MHHASFCAPAPASLPSCSRVDRWSLPLPELQFLLLCIVGIVLLLPSACVFGLYQKSVLSFLFYTIHHPATANLVCLLLYVLGLLILVKEKHYRIWPTVVNKMTPEPPSPSGVVILSHTPHFYTFLTHIHIFFTRLAVMIMDAADRFAPPERETHLSIAYLPSSPSLSSSPPLPPRVQTEPPTKSFPSPSGLVLHCNRESVSLLTSSGRNVRLVACFESFCGPLRLPLCLYFLFVFSFSQTY